MAEKKEVKLQFAQAVGMASVFADQATMQTLGDVILMTFYQNEPPITVEGAPEIESITAYPVTRVALRPESAMRLSKALGEIAERIKGNES